MEGKDNSIENMGYEWNVERRSSKSEGVPRGPTEGQGKA